MKRREFLGGAAGMAMAAIVVASTGRCALAAEAGAPGLPRPFKRKRPLVAIVADNRGTETTDLMIPQAVLQRSGLAQVVVVAPDAADIALMPALAIAPQQTLDAFDAAHPDGADYVIVPAFHHADCSGIVAWLQRQYAGGAFVAGICEGAKVLGKAGLLDGRRATTHWYAASDLKAAHPAMRWVSDRRYVVDEGIVTTTGVSASIPVSLALVEAIGGKDAAQDLAARIGVGSYADAHDSGRFHLDASHLWRVFANSAAFYDHETMEIAAGDGVDGLALALTADPWARTYRSDAVLAAPKAAIVSCDGLLLRAAHIDEKRDGRRARPRITLDPQISPAGHLDRALAAIAFRYGRGTADLVALQLEYTWEAS